MAMRTLVTFPGRAGDLLWACATIRQISATLGAPVDLQIAGEFESMLPLLHAQPYLGTVVADHRWGLSSEHSWEAPTPPPGIAPAYDAVYALGYRAWPTRPLPFEVYATAQQYGSLALPPLDLTQPWLTSPRLPAALTLAAGWSDCYFELKYGLHELVHRALNQRLGVVPSMIAVPPGSRWTTEGWMTGCSWLEAAARIASAKVFLGDCSALHVLAVGLGIPVVCYEPMAARWNEIFYPCGQDGPQVRLVKGGDGLPTQDSRHTVDALLEVLNASR